MMSPNARRLATMAASLLFCSMPIQAADTPPAAPEKGDLWEVTSQMSLEGMPMAMPARTMKVCTPKEWKEPPAGMDERQKCQTSDFKGEGSTYTWKVTCAGPPAMTGVGEMTRSGADAWSGLITFTGGEAAMKMKLNGKRLGECDLPKK